MTQNITGIVLAGGKSTRMGQPKALLPYKGVTLIERTIAEIQPYCQKVLISANEPECYAFLKLDILMDKNIDCGPLGGLEAGLKASETEYCFFVPCDLPYFSGAIISLLAAEIGSADICVPFINGYFEPLVSLYSKRALSAITECLQQKTFKVTAAFDKLQIKIVDEEKLRNSCLENIFLNINTFDEYNGLLRGDSNG